jgi:hypothetical protein
MDMNGFIRVFSDKDARFKFLKVTKRRMQPRIGVLTNRQLSDLACMFAYERDPEFTEMYTDVVKEISTRSLVFEQKNSTNFNVEQIDNQWEEAPKGYDVEAEEARLVAEAAEAQEKYVNQNTT